MSWHDDDRSYITPLSRVPSPSYIHRQTLKRVTVCIFGLVTPPFSQHHMHVLGCLFITFVSPPHSIAFLTKETHTHTHIYIYIYIYIYLHTKTQNMSNVTFTSKCDTITNVHGSVYDQGHCSLTILDSKTKTTMVLYQTIMILQILLKK